MKHFVLGPLLQLKASSRIFVNRRRSQIWPWDHPEVVICYVEYIIYIFPIYSPSFHSFVSLIYFFSFIPYYSQSYFLPFLLQPSFPKIFFLVLIFLLHLRYLVPHKEGFQAVLNPVHCLLGLLPMLLLSRRVKFKMVSDNLSSGYSAYIFYSSSSLSSCLLSCQIS